MPNQDHPQPQKESTNSVILKIVLILNGVLLVLMIGIWLGRTFAGDALPEGPEIVPSQLPSDGPYAVANSYVNIRSGPGTEYPAYGVAAPGSSAEIIGVNPDREWWMVRLLTTISPYGTGWVSADYVTAYIADQVPVPEPYSEPYPIITLLGID
jgi:hypothetical protein